MAPLSDSQRTQTVTVLGRDGVRHSCTLSYGAAAPWHVALHGLGSQPIEAAGTDLFDALANLRQELEPHGVTLLVQGARPDVLPSPMMRQAGSQFAYILRMGRPTRLQERVDIFAPASDEPIASVDEQRAFARAWIDSVRASSGDRK